MTDIELAKSILLKEDLALVVVKQGEVVFKSIDKGIRPMYILSTEMKDLAKGASIADRVIGRGAALLCGYLDIYKVYGRLISQGGIETLESENIPYILEKSCPYIKNRDGSDYCPIEKLSQDVREPLELLKKLEEIFTE